MGRTRYFDGVPKLLLLNVKDSWKHYTEQNWNEYRTEHDSHDVYGIQPVLEFLNVFQCTLENDEELLNGLSWFVVHGSNYNYV